MLNSLHWVHGRVTPWTSSQIIAGFHAHTDSHTHSHLRTSLNNQFIYQHVFGLWDDDTDIVGTTPSITPHKYKIKSRTLKLWSNNSTHCTNRWVRRCWMPTVCVNNLFVTRLHSSSSFRFTCLLAKKNYYKTRVNNVHVLEVAHTSPRRLVSNNRDRRRKYKGALRSSNKAQDIYSPCQQVGTPLQLAPWISIIAVQSQQTLCIKNFEELAIRTWTLKQVT